jgi:hypothetical protein
MKSKRISKKISKRKRSNKKINKKSRKSRNSRKNGKKVFKKGGNGEGKVNCCICGKEVNIDDTLIPSGCIMKYGNRGHRVCQECWWNPETGYGKEDSKHNCPGCEKGLPLTNIKIKDPVFVDLTEDDDDDA